MAKNYEPTSLDVLKCAADKLGKIKAQIADLKDSEEELKSLLIDSGEREVDGHLFRVTVRHAEREQVDVAALKDAVSRQFLIAHTSIIPTTTVRVTARKS